MSGKSSKSTTNSYTGSGQQWATPLAQQAVGSVNSVFNANQPGLQQLTDLTRNNVVNPALSQFQTSQGPANQASGYYSDVLGGKYLQGNPYIQQMIDQTGRDVTNNVNSQFETGGRYGSDAHGYGLARGLADSENGLRYNDYNTQMGRMDTAAQGAQAASTADISSLLAAIGAGAQLPYTGSSNLASSLGALFGGGNEKTVSTGAKPGLLDYLAMAAGNAASAASAGG
jgi:hypothetical protein